ncbi:MAG: imidazolonepropionase [Candidatus Aminicenantes bacterium]|nr:imidazolonepropionase [Candidatus Aminicenantes bacterium]
MKKKFKFSQIVTPTGKKALKGEEMSRLHIIKPGEIIVENGRIVEIGEKTRDADYCEEYFGKIAIPGLVDAHNHLVYGGKRVNEFEMKLKGVSYMEIAAAGGGIKSTVKATRNASKEELFLQSTKRAFFMLKNGTTSSEAKSGYGLNLEGEIKQLEVASLLNEKLPMDIVPVFLGGHDIPPDSKKEDYLELLEKELIPEVARRNLSKYFDAFCENGIYDTKDIERMFKVAKDYGFKLRLHTEEFSHMGGIPLAVHYGAVSVDHILFADENDVKLLAKSDTVAVIMPSVSFFLRMEKFAPARKIIDEGGAVALGTDLNPGSSPVESMFFPLWFAVFKMGLRMEEAITAATLNSAHVLGLSETAGSLEPGKKADFLIIDVEDYREIFYRPSETHIQKVFKEGKEVFKINSSYFEIGI